MQVASSYYTLHAEHSPHYQLPWRYTQGLTFLERDVVLCSKMFQKVPNMNQATIMKNQLHKEWVTLMQEGAHGQAGRFKLRAMRLAQSIRASDPEFSNALVKGLGDSSGMTRLNQISSASADAPDLLAIECEPALPITPHWPSPVEEKLRQIVVEWGMGDELVSAGLSPVKTALLFGPPGVGKSLAARWLSNELKLPLATLNLAATMNSYLGKTGQNIMRALDYAKSNPCILFLDEFDALAKSRGDEHDVGELKRVVNVLLQAVDQWDGPSLLIAATNYVGILDAALVRRFEQTIEFPQSTRKQIAQILESLGVSPELAIGLSQRLEGQPLSNATRLVNSARKRQVLEKIPFSKALSVAAEDLVSLSSPIHRRRSSVATMKAQGMSSHQIAKHLKISHTTVLRDLKPTDKDSQ